MATSLEDLILWRVIQGGAGAPLVPLGQAILLDAYPRRQHAVVMGIFRHGQHDRTRRWGRRVAGEISELYGWRWGFWMILPVAIVTAIGCRLAIPTRTSRSAERLDWSGFLTLSVAIACAQLMFSRGSGWTGFNRPRSSCGRSLRSSRSTCLSSIA